MKNPETTPSPTTRSGAQAPRENLPEPFQPFRWVEPGTTASLPVDTVMWTAGRIRDLTGGAGVLAEILERDDHEAGHDDARPLFDTYHRGELFRLLIAATQIAAEQADRILDLAGKDRSASN